MPCVLVVELQSSSKTLPMPVVGLAMNNAVPAVACVEVKAPTPPWPRSTWKKPVIGSTVPTERSIPRHSFEVRPGSAVWLVKKPGPIGLTISAIIGFP
jgi:hypothetical protein